MSASSSNRANPAGAGGSSEELPIYQRQIFKVIVLRAIESFIHKSIDETLSLAKMAQLINGSPLVHLARLQANTNKEITTVQQLPVVTIRDIILSITKIFKPSEIQILQNNDNFKVRMSVEGFNNLMMKHNGIYDEEVIQDIRELEDEYFEKVEEIRKLKAGEMDGLLMEKLKTSSDVKQEAAEEEEEEEEDEDEDEEEEEPKKEPTEENIEAASDKQAVTVPVVEADDAEDSDKDEYSEAVEVNPHEVKEKEDKEVQAAQAIENQEQESVEAQSTEVTEEKSTAESGKQGEAGGATADEQAEDEDIPAEEDENLDKKQTSSALIAEEKSEIKLSNRETRLKKRQSSISEEPRKRQKLEPSNKQLQILTLPLLDNISSYKYASTFLNPVNELNAPNYYSLIKNPTDLKTIRHKLKDGKMNSKDDIERDILLMYSNAIMYNKSGTDVFNWTKEMQTESDEYLQEFSRQVDEATQ